MGGGGGGGDPAITYSGVSTQATIDDSNAQELTSVAVNGADTGETLALGTATSEASAEGPQLRVAGLARTLAKAGLSVDPATAGAATAVGATQSESATIPGDCSGSFTYSLSYDDITGAFNGSFTFNNYNDCYGEVVNGGASISGTLNLSTEELEDFTFSFNNLSVTAGGVTETLAGTMAFESTGAYSYRVTTNIVYRDGTGDTYKLENYVVTFNEWSSPTVITVSGRAYHPDHGYVTITTPSSILVYSYNDYPHSGAVELSGAGGTKATVTFTGVNTYTIEVDSDGDDVVDTNYECTWSPESCTEGPI